MRSRRAWLRFVSLVGGVLRWKAEEGGGGSAGEALSGEFPSVKIGEEEVEEGVVGRGLSGEGVRDTARSGGTFDFSERKGPSITMSAVGKESMLVLIGKVEGNCLP